MAVDSKRALRALNVRIPVTLYRRIGVYCVEHDLTLRAFVMAAVESHLERLTRPTHAQTFDGVPVSELATDEELPGMSVGGGEDEVTREALARVERILDLSRSDLSVLLGIPDSRLDAPQNWPRQARTNLLQLTELADRLEETFEPTSIPAWLHAPNRDLKWRIPFDLLRQGQTDPINAALEAIDSGVYV